MAYDISKPADDKDNPVHEMMGAFIARLDDEAKRRVQLKSTVEQRWLEDLRQYNGQYDPDLEQRLIDKKRSRVFLNLTRPKTNALQARLWDLLFPTDDRNWGISPTPVPEMSDDAEEALTLAENAGETFKAAQSELQGAENAGMEPQAQALAADMEQVEAIKTEAEKAADRLTDVLNESKRRCRLMQEEIEDQLQACSYQAEARDVIEDACKIGIGVLKGPVLGDKARRRWQEGEAGHQLVSGGDDRRAAAYRVDPWGFFPSPDVRRIEDSEGVYERHLMNKQKLRKLAARPDIDEDAIRALMKSGPDDREAPSYRVDLHAITGSDAGSTKDLYQVWEYTGPIDSDDIALLAEATGENDLLDDVDDADPLMEWHARVWFCQGKLLSFGMHPLDSNESIYSVYNVEKDESSLYGPGVPRLMRDDQAILNSAQRAMMDNAGYTVGPQIVVNKDVVTPQNGSWIMEGGKIWERTANGADPNIPAFEVYNIESQQAALANIIELARRSIDEVTSLPMIAQGEQGVGITKTAQGMALLMNSANTVFKRFVKNFDDDITVPLIRRFYDWNMQFSDKAHIKGDFDVDARGTSVLLVREMQANNLILIAERFGDHPKYGNRIKHDELLNAIFRAHSIPADEITKTDREVEADRKKEQPAPEAQATMAKVELAQKEMELRERDLEAKVEMHNSEWTARRDIARMEHDRDLGKYAEGLNLKEREISGREQGADMSRADRAEAARIKAESDERKMAAEIAEKRRTGDSAGGSI